MVHAAGRTRTLRSGAATYLKSLTKARVDNVTKLTPDKLGVLLLVDLKIQLS